MKDLYFVAAAGEKIESKSPGVWMVDGKLTVKEWLASHKPEADGKVRVSTDYPDYFPVLTYAKDRKLALDLYKQFENRAADKNIAVLDKILK